MNLTVHTRTLAVLATAFLACSPLTSAQNPSQDGVQGVGKMSAARKLVSAEQIEAQAAKEYKQTLAEAQQQRALAPPEHPQSQRLRAIANRLIPHVAKWNDRSPQWQWEVNLIGSSQINAFCMPGGKIAFYSGILDTLKLTDDEVGLVMGHEIAHALREHGRERAGKQMAANIGTTIADIGSQLFGFGGLGRMVVGGGASLLNLKYGREDETEADLVGLDIAARAGFDPRSGVVLWQKMAAGNKGAPPQWLSTHPSGQNRIAEISKHLPEVMPLYAKTRGVAVAQLPAYQSNWPNLAPVK